VIDDEVCGVAFPARSGAHLDARLVRGADDRKDVPENPIFAILGVVAKLDGVERTADPLTGKLPVLEREQQLRPAIDVLGLMLEQLQPGRQVVELVAQAGRFGRSPPCSSDRFPQVHSDRSLKIPVPCNRFAATTCVNLSWIPPSQRPNSRPGRRSRPCGPPGPLP